MLTKTEFFNKYLGQKIEYDNVAPYQCIDYIKLYLRKCYGIRPGAWGNAKDYYYKFNNKNWAGYEEMHKYFKLISGKVIPERGDIVIFDGEYGHVAISDGVSDNKYMFLYEQNFASNKFVQRNKHLYSNMLGVLRPKYFTVSTPLNIRNTPSDNGEIIGEYPKYAFVEVYAKSGKWRNTRDGWCFYKYLD